jgi:hypothetical protein
VSEEIELVLCSSCLALVFQSRVLLSACCILVFHHSLAFSEGHTIFAVFWVALIRASWIAFAASVACDCVRLMLVRLLKVI